MLLKRNLLVAVGLATVAVVALRAAPQVPAPDARIDAIFAQWTEATPGCAVGVGRSGEPVLERAYGMADLEHDVRNTPATVFEGGSVAKQFTAAAVLLLVRDGKVSLDDPIRRYFPELPAVTAPVTVRHMLNHTSGLRDWGNLAGIAGWPRGTRVHTHAHVLEIISRQRAINFPPGSHYSYSNSGYNLAAMLVARVSGLPFAEFTRQRIFQPLGMTRTSWRDDYTRVVKGRAIAYAADGAAFRQDMPFENVHGNGGLLTTVGDLLRWNENFVTPVVGDTSFVALQQTTAPFTTRTMQTYAFGLMLGSYKGVREVSHSGSTAGYRAFLTRFPDQHLSVAVLCNAGSANPTAAAHAVADVYLAGRLNPAAPAPAAPAETQGPLARLTGDDTFRPTGAALAQYAGAYANAEVETTLVVAVKGGELVARRRTDTIALRPHSPDRFDGGSLGIVTFHRANGRVAALGITQDRVWDLRFARER